MSKLDLETIQVTQNNPNTYSASIELPSGFLLGGAYSPTQEQAIQALLDSIVLDGAIAALHPSEQDMLIASIIQNTTQAEEHF